MVYVTLLGKVFKLEPKGNTPKQQEYFRKIIKTIPGYKYIRKGDFYEVPIIELNSIIQILGKNRYFTDNKTFIVEEYKRAVSAFKDSLDKYNPVNFLDTLDTSKEYGFLKLKPKEFQKLAIEWACTPKGQVQLLGGLIADEVGLGKTFEAISTITNLKEQGKCKHCIIICPSNMRFQWGEEISKFTNETYKIINPSKKEKRLKEYESFDETFMIIGYELYRNDANDILQIKNNINPNLDFDGIVLDEAHKLKSSESLIYKTVNMIQPKVKLLLTATPIKRDIDDLFALFTYLHPDILMGWSYFKNKFLYTKEAFGKEIICGGRKDMEPLLHLFIAPYMLRRKSVDVSNEIPELIEKFVCIEPTKEQLKWFDRFTKEIDNTLRQAQAAVQEDKMNLAELKEKAFMSKFQALSVCSDHLQLLQMSTSKQNQKLLTKNPIKDFTSPKLDWLLDFIENNIVANNEFFGGKKEKLIIFTQYERMAQLLASAIQEKFCSKKKDDLKYLMFTGQIEKGCKRVSKDKLTTNCFECARCNECSSTEKSKFLFVNDTNVQILICTDAAQAGLNLQVSRYIVNYDLPYSPGSVEQRNGRIKRIGSSFQQVIAYNLYVRGSLDEKIVAKLEQRRDSIDVIVEASDDEKDAYAKHMPQLA